MSGKWPKAAWPCTAGNRNAGWCFPASYKARCRREKAASFGIKTKHEFAVYVTRLPLEFNTWQILQYYRERADTENVFEELKNQWGFPGFCAKSRATTELATRLVQSGRQKEVQVSIRGGLADPITLERHFNLG